MTREEMIEFIRHNLKIRVNNIEYKGEERFEVTLYMYVDGEVEDIDSDSIKISELK